MKLWHKSFIKVLPNKMLVELFDNLCKISVGHYSSQSDFHFVVKKINEFNKSHIYNYCCEVFDEIKNRDFREEEFNVLQEWASLIYNSYSDEERQIGASIPFKELFELPVSFMNERMFTQHFYELQEMYDLGILTDDEYDKIEQVYNAYYY